jgi:hypothetical protein
MSALMKPKKITLKTLDGEFKEFTLHRLPATLGREIAYQYLACNMPKIGNYDLSKELCNKMLGFVTVVIGDSEVAALTSDDLINNHCPDWEILSQLEDAMLDYNTSFLAGGKASIFSKILDRSITLLGTVILTDSSER